MPGATMSGLQVSPPRLLKLNRVLRAMPALYRSAPLAVESEAPELIRLQAVAGNPTVDRPGPELPALVQTYSVGFSTSRSFSQPPMRSSPSSTESMPNLMLITTGMPHFSSNSAAYS